MGGAALFYNFESCFAYFKVILCCDVLYKGWFTQPLHYIDWWLICGKIEHSKKAVIDQQGGNGSGASWMGQGVLSFFIGPGARAHLLTTRKRAVIWPAAIVRSPEGAAWASPSLPNTGRSADANSGLVIGAGANPMGLGGGQPPTSCAGYIPVHCLPLLPRRIKRIDWRLPMCYNRFRSS